MKRRIEPSPITPPDNHYFGSFFLLLFLGLSIVCFWRGLSALGLSSLSIALFFLAATIFFPELLSPLNKAWQQLGILLGKVSSPIILGIIFFGLVTPVGLFSRILGRDVLRLKKRDAETYLLDRAPASITPDSFKNPY